MTSEKVKILVVDDDKEVCNVINDRLSEYGYICSNAFNAHDALIKLREEDFNVTLLDVKLPGASGIELLRQIYPYQQKRAVIMITVVEDMETVIEAMKLGASDYILKPFNLNRLCNSIQSILENREYSVEKEDYKTLAHTESQEKGKQTESETSNLMNAIARGVAVKQDLISGHSKTVTQRTVHIARQLEIPEGDIQRWMATRVAHELERRREIEPLLDKLKKGDFVN